MSKSFIATLASCVTFCVLLIPGSTGVAQEYSFEVIDSAPSDGDVSPEFAKLFATKGVRVKRDGSRTVCDLWLRKEFEIDKDFEVTEQRLYPFAPGQLIGLLHFARRGSDFRDQDIASGWYSLRFELQPVDGNHVGTSPTRDFFLMVNLENDEPEKDWGQEELIDAAAEAAGSSHPAMMCLQHATEGDKITIRHDEANDWWVLHLVASGVADGKSVDVPIDLIVAGKSPE